MFVPTTQQHKVIDHFDGHALIVAGPGSGKTSTLIAHVKKLIIERNFPPDDIWILAFNRDISSKLREQIESELNEKSPQATTIHRFVLTQTLRYGKEFLEDLEIADSLGESGKRKLVWKPILKRLKEVHGITKTSYEKRLNILHVGGYLWNQLRDYWLTSDKPEDELFDKLEYEVRRLKKIYKIVFLDEVPHIFLESLKANPSFRTNVAKKRIIIDEFQDLNPTEHHILHQFHQEGTTIIAFGDDDQAVNDFRRAHADNIRDFVKIYDPEEYPLSRDRRCPKEILNLADEFVKGLPRLYKCPGHASHEGRVDILNFTDDEEEKVTIGAFVKKYLSLFSNYDENKTPQVLVLSGAVGKIRSKSRIEEIIEAVQNAGVTEVTGSQRKDPLDTEWGVAFNSFVQILLDGFSPLNVAAYLSVMTPPLMEMVHKYIEQQEQKGNYVDFLNASLELREKVNKIASVLSQVEDLGRRLDDDEFTPGIIIELIPHKLGGRDQGKLFINEIWEKCQAGNQSGADGTENNRRGLRKLFQLQKLLRTHNTENILKLEIGRVHVTTYRKAKGLEADLVIVTSVDSSDFSDEQQKRRLLYVSATRSKKNLLLTYGEQRSKARRFTRGRAVKYNGVPRVWRSPLIPSSYKTQKYSEQWLNSWKPL